jgi:hypothetical protein
MRTYIRMGSLVDEGFDHPRDTELMATATATNTRCFPSRCFPSRSTMTEAMKSASNGESMARSISSLTWLAVRCNGG